MHYPTIKQLRYFLALSKFEHFGHAANACHVSQSAFSVAIKELEKLLHANLVDRTNRQVVITELGQQVVQHAKICLAELDTLVELTDSRRDPLSGPLRLGVIPTIAPFLLPRILPQLGQKLPRLKLYLYEDTTKRIHQQLIAGELDAILVALPCKLHHVDMFELFKDRFVLTFNNNTRHFDPNNYRMRDVHADSIILLEDGHCLRDHTIAACKIKQTEKLNRFNASSLLTLIEMVKADLGITYLTQISVGSELLSNAKLSTLPLPKSSFRTIGLAWRSNSARMNEFKLFGSHIKSIYETLSALTKSTQK